MVQQPRPSTSEYRRSYKESKFRCFSKTYESNLDYRQCRRLAEFNHNVDVFTWNEPNWDSGSSSSSDNCRPASVPAHKFKHQKLTETYNQHKLNQTQEIQVKGPEVKTTVTVNGRARTMTPSPRAGEKTVVAQAQKKEEVVEEEQIPQEQVKDQAQQTSDDGANGCSNTPPSSERPIQRSHTRPKKPTQALISSKKRFVPKAKTFPAAVGRPFHKDPPEENEEKPPFLPYGYQDKEKVTGVKKTHNVRASHEVYDSALRALQRRKLQMEKQEEEAKSAPYRERRKKALFNNFDEWTKRETTAWDTEYRRHFVGYNSQTYERNVSARLNPARRYAGERLLSATA